MVASLSSAMLPAKLLLVACLIVIAVSSDVDQSETRTKPAHHVAHHSSHRQHTSTAVSSEHVKHDHPLLDEAPHDLLPQESEQSKILLMELQQHETTDVLLQEEITHPLTDNDTAAIVISFEETGLENEKLETFTHSLTQHSTPDSPITQLDVPQQEEVTHSFTHHTTGRTDEMPDLGIPFLETNDHEYMQQENMAANASHATEKSNNSPQHHRKHHVTHHKKDLPVDVTEDNVDDKHPLKSVNHYSTHINQETITSMESQLQGREAKAHGSARPENDLAQASPEIEADTPSKEIMKNKPTDTDQESSTDTPPIETHLQDKEHYYVYPEDEAAKASPKTVSDNRPEKMVKTDPTDTEQEPTASSPILKSDITTQEEGNLPSLTESPTVVSQNVTTKQTPLDEQLELSKITSLSASQDIQPNKSTESGNGNIEDHFTNMSDTNMTEDAYSAENKLYAVKVNPLKPNRLRNPANGNRQRSTLQEPVKERRIMAQARDLNPSDKRTRIIHNRQRKPSRRQHDNEEQIVSDKMKPVRKNMERQVFREGDNKRPRNLPTSGFGRTSGNIEIKERVRSTEQQFVADETIPAQGTMRMDTLEKKVITGRNQMLPLPKRISGKARVNGEQFIDEEDGHVATLRTHSDTREGSNVARPTQTSVDKNLEDERGEQMFLTYKTRPIQGRIMKTASLDERDNNRANQSVPGPRQIVGNKKPGERFGARSTRPTQERRHNRRNHTLTGPRQSEVNNKSEPRFSEKPFLAAATKSYQGNMKTATLLEERRDNHRERTFTGQRRKAGNNQVKGRGLDTEFVAGKIILDQGIVKVRRGNRRNDQHVSGRERTSGDESVERGDSGQRSMASEIGDVEPELMEERRSNKHTNPSSVSLRQSSGTVKTHASPLQSEDDAPGTRTIKTAEIENRRASRPSSGLRYTPGYKQGTGENYQADSSEYDGNSRSVVRRVNGKTQSYLRDGNSDEGGDGESLRRDHIRKKRRARMWADTVCTKPGGNGKTGNAWYLARKEDLGTKCARCFETKSCTARDVVACNAAGINLLAEEDSRKFEKLFRTVNLFGCVWLCVLVGILIYVYIYYRVRKDWKVFVCAVLMVLCIFYLHSILALVNGQKWFG